MRDRFRKAILGSLFIVTLLITGFPTGAQPAGAELARHWKWYNLPGFENCKYNCSPSDPGGSEYCDCFQ